MGDGGEVKVHPQISKEKVDCLLENKNIEKCSCCFQWGTGILYKQETRFCSAVTIMDTIDC